jgi:hypothetical protein
MAAPTPWQAHIIARLGLQGTVLEQFALTPGAVSNPEGLVDSPSLMRFAQDVQRALATEGWRPLPSSGKSRR